MWFSTNCLIGGLNSVYMSVKYAGIQTSKICATPVVAGSEWVKFDVLLEKKLTDIIHTKVTMAF